MSAGGALLLSPESVPHPPPRSSVVSSRCYPTDLVHHIGRARTHCITYICGLMECGAWWTWCEVLELLQARRPAPQGMAADLAVIGIEPYTRGAITKNSGSTHDRKAFRTRLKRAVVQVTGTPLLFIFFVPAGLPSLRPYYCVVLPSLKSEYTLLYRYGGKIYISPPDGSTVILLLSISGETENTVRTGAGLCGLRMYP